VTGEGGIDAVLRLYPAWWRARYGDEVRTVSSDAVAGGQSTRGVIIGLLFGAIRLRATGAGTPRQSERWARRTRACIIVTMAPVLVVLPLFFLTLKLGLEDRLPVTPSTTLSGDGHVAYDAIGIMALAGLMVMGTVIGGYMSLAGATIRENRGIEHRARHTALAVVTCILIVVVAVTAGLIPVFALVALGFIVWGSVLAARSVRRSGATGRGLRRLVPVPGLLAGLSVVGCITATVVGPHRFVDRHGVDVPLNGHPAVAHSLMVASAVALGLAWTATFVMLAVLGRATRPGLQDLQSGRGFGVAASALLWVMAAAAMVSDLALGRQQSLHLPAYRVVTTSWGHGWMGGGPALIVAASVSTLGAIATVRSWKVTAQLAT
jgi:hypothetical protein